MPDQQPPNLPAPTRLSFAQAVKRTALALLFSAILLIPRLRRLRRRLWAWSAIRVAASLGGVWLIWRFSYAGAGAGRLLCGLALVAFGLLVQARPEGKPTDGLARELNALIVVNGGSFFAAPARKPVRGVSIFVNPERLLVIDPRQRQLVEIPLASLRELKTHNSADGSPPVAGSTWPHETAGGGSQPWNLEIVWESGEVRTSTFRYEGFFAEHLARVAETTLRGVWKKGLPVLK